MKRKGAGFNFAFFSVLAKLQIFSSSLIILSRSLVYIKTNEAALYLKSVQPIPACPTEGRSSVALFCFSKIQLERDVIPSASTAWLLLEMRDLKPRLEMCWSMPPHFVHCLTRGVRVQPTRPPDCLFLVGEPIDWGTHPAGRSSFRCSTWGQTFRSFEQKEAGPTRPLIEKSSPREDSIHLETISRLRPALELMSGDSLGLNCTDQWKNRRKSSANRRCF